MTWPKGKENFSIGDHVIFTGCSEDQRRWGSNDNPNDKLIKGNEYIISYVEIHSWHTKVSVEGIEGKFNSVCFDLMDDY